ncbi:MAG: esterase/lipase family protein [Planctomycetota bacterium]
MRTQRIAWTLLLLAIAAAPVARADPPPRGLSPAVCGWPRAGELVAVVVHGIHPVHEDLDPLAADLAERGFRVLRFVYDDKADLDRSAEALARDLEGLVRAARPSEVAVVAHSMGGLVSRRALSADLGLGALPVRFRLLTVATPFGGFASANWSRFDLGLGPKVFHTLGSRARFIRRPGALAPNATHVKVETDERDLRRRGERDDKVKLKSQVQEIVDAAACARYRLRLGHVGSIRDEADRVPEPLRELLTRHLGPPRARLAPGLAQDPRSARGLAQTVQRQATALPREAAPRP